MKRILFFSLGMFFFAFSVFGLDVKIFLKNNSVLYGKIDAKVLFVDTKYGKLEIPFEQASKIVMGKNSYPNLNERLNALLDKMRKAGNKEQLELADEMAKIGIYARDFLEEAFNRETQLQIILGDVIATIDNQSENDANESLFELDEIFAPNTHFYGTIENKNFVIETSFGKITLSKHLIYKIEAVSDKTEKEVFKLTLPATTIAAKGFLDSKIKVKKGDRLMINTTGNVKLASLNNLEFGPEGEFSQGNWNGFPFGALCARIGDKGTVFLAGKEYRSVVKESGNLFLTISETVYNQNNTGNYQIRITIIRN